LKTFIDCNHYYQQSRGAHEEVKRLNLKLNASNNDRDNVAELKAEIAHMAAKIKELETNANISEPNEMAKHEFVQKAIKLTC
jgi:hypothetical protein